MGRDMGGRFGREEAWVHLWLILADLRQKTTKFCKAVILQLKKKRYIVRNHTHNHTLKQERALSHTFVKNVNWYSSLGK